MGGGIPTFPGAVMLGLAVVSGSSSDTGNSSMFDSTELSESVEAFLLFIFLVIVGLFGVKVTSECVLFCGGFVMTLPGVCVSSDSAGRDLCIPGVVALDWPIDPSA